MKTILFCLLALSLTIPASADTDFAATAEKIKAALEHERRPDADRERDRNRRALQTLEFFGLRDDMRVLELVPGGGWYTRILGPVLAERGELFLAINAGRAFERFSGQPGFESTDLVPFDRALMERDPVERRTHIKPFQMDVEDIDLALTFRNLHNFTEQGRQSMNDAVFAALKPGGLYGVVDHTRRHMQQDDRENRRRMDPVLMIKEIEAAGFEFVDFTDLHYRLDDELRYEVGRRSVAGNTDRFTLLFRKPE